SYSLAVETAWIHITGAQGFQRVRYLLLLAQLMSSHALRVRVAYDYNTAWVQDKTLDISAAIPSSNDPEQIRFYMTQSKCEAIKVRLEDVAGSVPYTVLESLRIQELAFRIGAKVGMKHLPPAQQFG